MIFKCKICGGTLNVEQGKRTAVCEYCGVEQTIPSLILTRQKIFIIRFCLKIKKMQTHIGMC